MATTYHDWITQTTAAARLARLELHIAEVQAMASAGPDVSADGKSVSRASIGQTLTTLFAEREKLLRDPSLRRAGGLSLGRLTSG